MRTSSLVKKSIQRNDAATEPNYTDDNEAFGIGLGGQMSINARRRVQRSRIYGAGPLEKQIKSIDRKKSLMSNTTSPHYNIGQLEK